MASAQANFSLSDVELRTVGATISPSVAAICLGGDHVSLWKANIQSNEANIQKNAANIWSNVVNVSLGVTKIGLRQAEFSLQAVKLA